MTPGQHSLEPVSPDRSLGDLRDTIYIILPGPKVMLVALHRADLSGTVAETCVKYGHGGLNINACRIKHANPEDFAKHKSMVDRLKANGGSLGDSWKNSSDLSGASEVSTAGRWPPNVLLVHGPGCRQIGSQTIPKNIINASARTTPSFLGLQGRSFESQPEEIPVWDCQHDCPVRLLDEQTGDRPGMPLTTQRQGASPKGYGIGLAPDDASMSPGYGDDGGASRFFPTFPNLDAAQKWLQTLIGNET